MSGPVGAKSTRDQLLGRTDVRSNAQPRHSSGTGLHEDVLSLQRVVGNRAVSELLRARDDRPVVDLRDVRVHTGPDADARAYAVGAAAYASGRDVYLGSGIDLTTDLGQRVLAHELAHIVQQERGRAGTSLASEASLERDANATARTEADGNPKTSMSSGGAVYGSVQKLDRFEVSDEKAFIRKTLAASPEFWQRFIDDPNEKEVVNPKFEEVIRENPDISQKLFKDPVYVGELKRRRHYKNAMVYFMEGFRQRADELQSEFEEGIIKDQLLKALPYVYPVVHGMSTLESIYQAYETEGSVLGALIEVFDPFSKGFKAFYDSDEEVGKAREAANRGNKEKAVVDLRQAGRRYFDLWVSCVDAAQTGVGIYQAGRVIHGGFRAPSSKRTKPGLEQSATPTGEAKELPGSTKVPAGQQTIEMVKDPETGAFEMRPSETPGERSLVPITQEQSQDPASLGGVKALPAATKPASAMAGAQPTSSLTPLSEPPEYARGGPLTPAERQRAEQLLNRSLGRAQAGPAKITSWPSKPSKSGAQIIESKGGKPSVAEFTGRGEKGELVTVRTVRGQSQGRVARMEIENINKSERDVRDTELARAMKAAGMGDWQRNLGHIQPSAAKGAEMPYNLEPQAKSWNQQVAGRVNRRTAESAFQNYLNAHPSDVLNVEITRRLSKCNALLSERFCIRDVKGNTVFDVEVTTRGKFIKRK